MTQIEVKIKFGNTFVLVPFKDAFVSCDIERVVVNGQEFLIEDALQMFESALVMEEPVSGVKPTKYIMTMNRVDVRRVLMAVSHEIDRLKALDEKYDFAEKEEKLDQKAIEAYERLHKNLLKSLEQTKPEGED